MMVIAGNGDADGRTIDNMSLDYRALPVAVLWTPGAWRIGLQTMQSVNNHAHW